ncbi:cobamide remodeling phosphodiesterase CbiR [Thiovibrio sp. JS02]
MTPGKGRYPWRLGATSFVVPADMTSNVRILAPLVDDVQLLFFESATNARLPQEMDCAVLAGLQREHGLSYTVHLPIDIRLGAAERGLRQQGIGEICRLMAALAPLVPSCYDLHLVREEELPVAEWLDHLDNGLEELASRLGAEKKLVAVENIEYPYGLVAALVAGHGFGHCLDWGHLHRHGHDRREALARLGQVRHLHYHGVQGKKDHQALADAGEALRLGEALAAADFQGVVTLELYSLAGLEASLAMLGEAWQPFGKNEY